MRKILSLVLALSMVLGMFSFAFAANLSDIEGEYYEAAVEALVELGVVNGYGDNTFKPNNEVTRAEMAKMLVIALGQKQAAEIAKGSTQFSDVAADHWAAGFINVAAQYKVIVGYPDGTFAPEAKVTYAEAVTMALRALGYKNVVESAGTWPTNYITKASELQLLDGMKYNGADDGAKRGNVAILLWNMLKTEMWGIKEENQINGMTYGKLDYMLNTKFPDYKYGKMTIESLEINNDGEVEIDLDPVEDEDVDPVRDFTYDGNNFYEFVTDTEVEVLVNTDSKKVLTMVPTADNKLVDGAKNDIDADYEELRDNVYDYAYARVEKKAIKAANVISTSSLYVDELETKTDYVRVTSLTSEKLKFDDFDSRIILKDGERVTLKDLKEGDVLTEVTVYDLDGDVMYTFYVIGSEKAEGELTKFHSVKYDKSTKEFYEIIVSKEKYVVDAKATYVEDPDAKSLKVVEFKKTTAKEEMENEEVELILDGLYGKVVRVFFDGKIDAGNESETSVKFFAIVENGIDRDGKTYTITVENEDGEETYEFVKNSDAEQEAKAAYANGFDGVGDYVAIWLNDEDKVENLEFVADYNRNPSDELLANGIKYGDEPSEVYGFRKIENASYDKNNKVVISKDESESIKVNSSTIVVKLVKDDKGTAKTSDDEYRVEFDKGLDAIAKIKSEPVVYAIYDEDASFERAKYILMGSDASDKSDNRVGIVDDSESGAVYVGGATITVGDDEDMLIANGTRPLTGYQVLVYTVTTNSKSQEILNYVAGLNDEELDTDYDKHLYVAEVSGDEDRAFIGADDKEYDLNEYEDKYEDYMVVVVRVSESDDDETQFEATDVKVIDWEDIELSDYDRISIDEKAEVIFIIRGMGEI